MNTYGRALSRKMSFQALLAGATLDHCQPAGEEQELDLPLAFSSPSEPLNIVHHPPIYTHAYTEPGVPWTSSASPLVRSRSRISPSPASRQAY